MKIRHVLLHRRNGLCWQPRRLADDKGLDNHVKRAPYYDGLKGKKVVFVPLAMGFDLTEGWAAIMRRQAKDLGYSFEIRDPNWSTDAGTRAITDVDRAKSRISLIVHNPDLQSYARLEQRTVQAGIKVLQVNLETINPTDYLCRRGLGEGGADRGAGAGRPLRQGIGQVRQGRHS